MSLFSSLIFTNFPAVAELTLSMTAALVLWKVATKYVIHFLLSSEDLTVSSKSLISFEEASASSPVSAIFSPVNCFNSSCIFERERSVLSTGGVAVKFLRSPPASKIFCQTFPILFW